jgi:hypothetical protein
MKKRNSVPFFTKVPFAYYKNVTVGQSPNQASLIKTRSKQLYSIPSIPSTPNSPVIPAIPKVPNIPVKNNRAPKNDFGDTRRRIRKKSKPESITAAPKEINESFGSKGQILDSEMNELELIEEQ